MKVKEPKLHAWVADVAPVLAMDVAEQPRASQEDAHVLLASIRKPIASPDFSISQRVDYFPVRSGMEAILPMSCLIAWTGERSTSNLEIAIVESVVDSDLDVPILERKLDSPWTDRGVFWERDGQLRPGHYVWQVAVAGLQGHICSFRSGKRHCGILRRSLQLRSASLVLMEVLQDARVGKRGLRKRHLQGHAAAAPDFC